ncbi:MAG: RecX family transcriptional regulator [Legionellales bacterium]|nr:RecX family transcriptional regulator [Legionellales bacterium]
MQQKLQQRGFADNVIENVLQELVTQGWQSDERWAQSLIHSRMQRGYGPLRICAELKQHGLDAQQITQYLAAHESDDWYALCQQVQRKRFKHWPQDALALSKQQRFLQYRGFNHEQIQSVFATMDDE